MKKSEPKQLDHNGKLPPQAVDLEEYILGAIMLDRDAMSSIITDLSPKCFYKEAHERIYVAMCSMYNNNKPIDLMTVIQELKGTGELELCGGAYYINQLTSTLPSSANIEYHSKIILQKFIQRELIRVSTDIIRESYEETTDALELLEKSQDIIGSIGISETQGTQIDAATRMKKTMEKIKKGINESGITGVPCGISSIDRFTGGFQKGDLTFIGARPGNFKTGIIMALAHKMHPLGFTPYISQQEMAMEQSGMRELAMHSGVNTQDLRRGLVSDAELEKLEAAAAKISKMNVYINHTGGMSISKIKASVRKQSKIKKIDILFIDYLQLMEMETKGKQATEEAVIAATTRKLKLMAKELDIPVVVLSQLSREVEKRQNKKPVMSDLKGSGAIEADADTVILLYNPSQYFDNPKDEAGNDLNGKMEVIFCKNRQGSLGSVYLTVDAGTNNFDNDTTFPIPQKPMPRNLNMADEMEWANPDKRPF